MNQARYHSFAGISLAAVIAAAPSVAAGQHDQRHGSPLFENYTEQAGISYRGQTWGASWRDFDTDGKPDFVVSNHFTGPGYEGPMAGLFHNLGDGRFSDIAGSLLGNLQRDLHGGSWADFDNDGDADLFFSVGGAAGLTKTGQVNPNLRSPNSNLLFVQENGHFTERAAAYGLALPTQRGRRASWFDVDNDGKLDSFLAQATPDGPESILYLQRPAGFTPCSGAFPDLVSRDNSLVFLAFPGFEDDARYVLMQDTDAPGRLYRYRGGAHGCEFEPKPDDGIDPVKGVRDFVLADLTGDLSLDYFAPTLGHPPFERHSNPRHLVLGLPGAQPFTEIPFRASGPVRLKVLPAVGDWGWARQDNPLIFLGPMGKHPPGYQFTLDPADTSLHGAMNADKIPLGCLIHFDPSNSTWYLRIKKDQWRTINIALTSESPIERLSPPLSSPIPGERPTVLLTQSDKGWEDYRAAAGLGNLKVSCLTAVGADFDNDMDLDLYLGCSDDRGSHRNIYLENRNGRFVENPDAGAPGQTEGLLDSVTTADFDNNGFPDLLVTYGGGNDEEVHGPITLYRNIGNHNNWVKLKLTGSRSNRDAYGARIFLTSGGKTQMRYLSGGIHATGQDDSIIAFGLGQNTAVQELIVEWPNRSLERFDMPAINQTTLLTEGQGQTVTAPVILTANHKIAVGSPARFLLLAPRPISTEDVLWRLDDSNQISGKVAIRHQFDAPGKYHIRAELSAPDNRHETVEAVVDVDSPPSP